MDDSQASTTGPSSSSSSSPPPGPPPEGAGTPTAEQKTPQPTKDHVLKSTTSGLSFLALLAFVASFLSARTFATLNPSTVVKTGGIHFHHFWYGLTLIIVVGWIAIAYDIPRYRRVYAVVFGLGCGLIGDEIGLFLTMGNYNSSLTFFFFVIVVSVGSMVVLLRDRKSLQYDVIGLKVGEILLLVGIVIMGMSALAFADGLLIEGVVIVGIGGIVAVAGIGLHHAKK
jgi:hypothetical protein